jgi:phosphopantetheine--protein transferase-like protein
MKSTNVILNTVEAKDTLILESDWNSIPDLNSPVLIILKTNQVGPEKFALMESFLSEQEIAKSRRFRFVHDSKSYIVVHGFLRWILGRYLGISPEAIEFNCGLYGKPAISGYSRKMFFNLSHSSGVSVLAFDPEHEVGVDIEKIDEEFEYDPIVQHFFTHEERQYIQHSKEAEERRFYEIWTRKEAYLKALGTGITKDLHVEVLKEKMSGNRFLENETDRMDFLFRSMIFEQHFEVTLAMSTDSHGIRAYVIKNNGNGLPINEV